MSAELDILTVYGG